MPDLQAATSRLGGQLSRLGQRSAAEPVILELDLTEGVRMVPANSPVPTLPLSQKPKLPDLLLGLERGRTDDRVAGLIAKIGPGRMKLGVVEELRHAVLRFGAAGKHTVAWSESMGEFDQGTLLYYLASAFSEIHLQPSGDLGLIGVTMQAPFAREAMDRIGVRIDAGSRHEYKTAANTFTENGYTKAHRESDEQVVDSLTGLIAGGIAESRGLTTDQVRQVMDRAPLLASEALEAGLVDRLSYRDEVYDALRTKFGDDCRLRYVTHYARSREFRLPSSLPFRRGDGVALIHLHGTIRLGRGSPGRTVGSATTTDALRAAIADPHVKAIVLRVESPGGSYAASDAIWREVARAKRCGKPVIGSLGSVAASGGYFVVMGADAIVAQAGSLTASIGVFGGKPVLSELLERVGVRVDGVSVGGRHSRMFSKTLPFSEDEVERLNAWLDRVYTDFVDRAAQGRQMDPERMRELARGRVWTGADARERGLVDTVGDLHTAVGMARSRAGLPGDAPVVRYPKNGLSTLLRPPRSSDDRLAATRSAWAGVGDPLSRITSSLGLPSSGPLIHPFSLEIR